MLQYLIKENNAALTANGGAAYRSTGNECLDLFASVGALRRVDEGEIAVRFMRAYAENSDMAMKLLFFARDVRGGLGERRFFRAALRRLAFSHPESVTRNAAWIAEYGRWDDLLVLLDTPCETAAVGCIKKQLEADIQSLKNGGRVSLLAKWLPSVNTSSRDAVRRAKLLARRLGMTEAQYRKTLSALRKRGGIVENYLRVGKYTFLYSKLPSRAAFKYRRAFGRNDGARYSEFLERVYRGEDTLHADGVMPYDIVRACIDLDAADTRQRLALDVSWKSLEDFGTGENALAVVDGSGSMYCAPNALPAAVAMSLGIYFAQHNTGEFHNRFITFSHNPELVTVKGADIRDQVEYCMSYNGCENTDVAAVFELILSAAVKNRVPQSEMPTALYIISDMEFDDCSGDADETCFENAKRRFAAAGYELPRVVFWNVSNSRRCQAVTQNEQGVSLVSGFTPRLFSMLCSGQLSPREYMEQALNDERYRRIVS